MKFGENNVAMADRTIRIAIAVILFAFIILKDRLRLVVYTLYLLSDSFS